MKRAVLFGASGLVGNTLLHLLLAEEVYSDIIAFGRSALAIDHPRLHFRTIDFHHLEECQEWLSGSDVFCCLGTTMKKAGSREAFREVDYTYPLEIARLSSLAGARQFLIITAMGADSHSSFFYNRVKGDLENALQQLRLPALHIFRPSLLLGNRQEYRRGEAFGARISPLLTHLMIGPFRVFRPVQANDVAAAMIHVSRQEIDGNHIYPSDEISRLAHIRK
ncbi:hypothetical protein AN963_14220 [Brevibacillus choshinensis]|uniref:Nucleoside-diphosphate sugar epimerase n=1 Tax=Brevibacillus choshinensis TaxID=54911 RepID=A0ABR5N6X4_BRECH|nr:NAD(P)H-binding protein [Brevibacillus choshinensis]KQL46139.1 hypothetical protein AN963_14220 [Brevibacillus choshinensis]